jgi:glycosyltransferase involved in cell wall biosynthesis
VRILIAGTTYLPAFNGQAIFTTNLAEGLAQRGHQVCMVTPSENGKSYQISHNGVLIYTTHSIELKQLHEQAYVSFLPDLEIRRIFNSFHPEIVHLQDHYPLSKCVLKFARMNKIPVIGTNHFVPENLTPYMPLPSPLKPAFKRLLWWWMKRVYNHLDCVTAPSMTAVNILRVQHLYEPILPISCGVSFKIFHPDHTIDREEFRRQFGLETDGVTFMFVGRVDSEKRLDVLIKAVHLLNRPDIKLVITGKGAALHEYQALAEALGVEDQVKFTGFVAASDLPILLNSIDIFAMPSEAELLSIASLEAMATGLPLLAARSKALPELVDDGVNGYLFEPGNVQDAARLMARLADQPELWQQMGKKSLEKVQIHSLDHVISSYEELYSSYIHQQA